jgi:wyosine [tRNA(Phe)-imidazoG37] synthetase (radical SAM superfamily)
MDEMRIFGPVPSRRLGKSVGINNIPPKICTYSCVYCQLGRSLKMVMNRCAYYDPDELLTETTKKIQNASFNNIHCTRAYLSIPTRPPALKWVRPPEEQKLNRACQVFDTHGIHTEYLIGYEGNQFAYTGNIQADILSITSVHPMREDAVYACLKKANSDFSIIEKLLTEKKLLVSTYNNERFYLRALIHP